MRLAFFTELYRMMVRYPEIFLIISDNGAIVSDDLRKDLKKRYINVGVSEQNMIGVAAGMALMGKVVYAFTMVPFATMRCYEQIRIDMALQNSNVKIIGVGPGFDYSTLGPTHHGYEDISLMRGLPHMTVLSPSDDIMAKAMVRASYQQSGPVYIRLDRNGQPFVYQNRKLDLRKGFEVLSQGEEIGIITTGRMVHTGLKVRDYFLKYKKKIEVIDLFRLKPVNENALIQTMKRHKHLVTLEEHFVTGGLGSIVSEIITDHHLDVRLERIGIPDTFYTKTGTREYAYKCMKIDFEHVVRRLKEKRIAGL
ncbi:MAG: transketolase C-terminal domain-containing protein [bacterium]|nr:transketolase C-terminal domain-containing protein [bacterium]